MKTLVALIESGAARDFRASRGPGGEVWSLSTRLGRVWLPVRSRREPIRTWGEPDRAEAILRDGGHSQYGGGVLAGDSGFTRLDMLGIRLAAGTGGFFQGRRQWWAHVGAE
jgi:hypothetical protein